MRDEKSARDDNEKAHEGEKRQRHQTTKGQAARWGEEREYRDRHQEHDPQNRERRPKDGEVAQRGDENNRANQHSQRNGVAQPTQARGASSVTTTSFATGTFERRE